MRKILSLILGLLWTLPVWGALPSGYTQLEYIESTGTQWIDTGVVPEIGDTFDIDYKYTTLPSGTNYQTLLSAGTGNYQLILLGSNNIGTESTRPLNGFYYKYFATGEANAFATTPSVNEWYNITINSNGTATSDGQTSTSTPVEELDGANTSLYLFIRRNGTSPFYGAIRKFQMSRNGALVRNFVPAKNSSGAVGLYDTVSGEFFENAGTGEFIAGPVVEIKIATTKYNETAFSPLNTALANAISVVDSVVSNTITQAGRIATLQAQKQTRPNDIADDNEKCPAGKKCLLVEDATGVPHWYEIVENAWDLPVGYTQLQYIESTGTQYIDTGYIPNSNTRWELDNEYTETPPAKNFYNGLYQQTATATGFQAPRFDIALGVNGMYLNYGASNTVNSNTSSFINTRYMYVVDAKNNKWAYNDTTGSFPSYSNMATITKPLYLFARNDAASVDRFAKQRTYSSKIYDDGILVRNFVPAKNASGVVGMYDTVGGRFYENAGTGEFIGGQPVFN